MVEWKNEIDLERLKTKFWSLPYSPEDHHAVDFKNILDKIFKGNDCEVPSDHDDDMKCAETKKDTELAVWMK